MNTNFNFFILKMSKAFIDLQQIEILFLFYKNLSGIYTF